MINSKSKIKKNDKDSYEWNVDFRFKIVDLISHVVAHWTLQNSEYFEQMKGVAAKERRSYLLTPHPGQIISIFRLLGIGFYELREKKTNFLVKGINYMRSKEEEKYNKVLDNKLRNNLVQVETGEGKSLILAVAFCVLVLLGAEVSCVCYSDYLSSRDYDSLKPIFEALNITQNIHYGTVNQICENILNEHGDIRSSVVNFILNKKEEKIKSVSDVMKPRVLLIDEVDVFFSDTFYGNIYTPLALLKDPIINNLTSYLFENRATMLNINTLEKVKNFKLVASVSPAGSF